MMYGMRQQRVMVGLTLCSGCGLGQTVCGTLRIRSAHNDFLAKKLSITIVVLVHQPLNESKHRKTRYSLSFLMCTQHHHVVPRDTPMRTHTLTYNHSTAQGSRLVIHVA